MDAINSNYSQFAANFASKLGQINGSAQTQGTGEVAKEQSVTSGSQVILSESTDKMSYVASHPQLAESANLTSEESNELLQSTSEKIVSAETSCRGNTVLFDIYSILALIQETSQEMRNAERDLRMAENQSIQSSIKSQAALQRTAALTQLITGCVSAGISLGMMGYSAYGMSKNVTQTNARQNAAGLDTMKQQENILACSDNPKAAETNLGSVKSSMSQEAIAEVDTAFAEADKPTATENSIAECKTNCEAAGHEVTAAKSELSAAQGELSKCKPGTPEYNAVNQKVIAAGDKLSAAEGKLTQANQEMGEVMKDAPEKVANEKAEQMGGVVDKYQSEFDKVSTKASNELEKNGKLSPETKAELQEAGQKLNYARAKQVNECAHMDGAKPTKYMSEAFKSVSTQTKAIEKNTETGTAAQQKSAIQAQMLGNAAVTAGQLFNSIGQGISGMINAEATAIQADQKAAEESLDQVKDLFNNTQQLIQQTIQIFSSVVSKESQSIEEIIGGIKA